MGREKAEIVSDLAEEKVKPKCLLEENSGTKETDHNLSAGLLREKLRAWRYHIPQMKAEDKGVV